MGGLVGYSIRLEAKTSAKTRLLFCTTGILLKRLESDPLLSDVTHIIVDEVHERSEESGDKNNFPWSSDPDPHGSGFYEDLIDRDSGEKKPINNSHQKV